MRIINFKILYILKVNHTRRVITQRNNSMLIIKNILIILAFFMTKRYYGWI